MALIKLRSHNPGNILLAIFVAGLAILVRLFQISRQGLWYDELMAVNFSILPIQGLLRAIELFDSHPPLYYLQLHYWMQAGTSDIWLRLNPALWSILSLASLWITTRIVFGDKISMLAAGLYAISPMAVFYAQEVRMYSFMMFSVVWIWFFTYQFFRRSRPLLAGIGIVLSTFAFLYSQGAAFLILASTLVYAASFWFIKDIPRRTFALWAGIQVLVILFYLPWLVRAENINVAHTLVPNISDILDTLTVIVFGIIKPRPVWLGVLSVILFLFIGIIIHKQWKSLSIYLSFLLVPLLAGMLISYTVRPIWFYRTFSFITPLLSLCAALAVDEIYTWVRRNYPGKNIASIFIAALLPVLVLLALVYQQSSPRKIWTPRDAVQLVQSQASNNDLVVIPNSRFFWSWDWYAAGPGKINILNSNFKIKDRQGIETIASRDVEPYLLDGKTVWLVSLDTDNITPLAQESYMRQEIAYDNYHIRVAKIFPRQAQK